MKISESDKVEDIVIKNRNLLIVEFQGKACAAKSLQFTFVLKRRPDWDSRSVRF